MLYLDRSVSHKVGKSPFPTGVDNVEDGTIRDGHPETINLATGCLFAAQLTMIRLSDFSISQRQAPQVINRLARACLDTCSGQQADLSANRDHPVLDPNGWFKMISLKSEELFICLMKALLI